MSISRERLRELIREEVLRWVDQARRPALRAGGLGLLATGISGWPETLAGGVESAMKAGMISWIAGDGAFQRAPCWVNWRHRFAVPPDREPHIVPLDPLPMDALKAAKGILVVPASLSTLTAVIHGAWSGPARVIVDALALGLPVTAVGTPHRAEGWAALSPGHPLWAHERDVLTQAQRLGIRWIGASEWASSVTAASSMPKDGNRKALFFTVADIEDLAKSGKKDLLLQAGDRVTPAARDRAGELRIQLIEPS